VGATRLPHIEEQPQHRYHVEVEIMTQHTDQTVTQSEGAPARIQLEDFIEAVTRGVTRALAAEEEVNGYAARQIGRVKPPVTVLAGIFPWPAGPFTDVYGSQGGADMFGGQGGGTTQAQ
jgi:hypothetical protein